MKNLDSGFLLAKHADELGAEYLTKQKKYLSRKQLLSEILSEKPVKTFHQQNRLPDYRVVQNKIRADFSSEKTVCLKGWVLSETEANLCALYTMTS